MYSLLTENPVFLQLPCLSTGPFEIETVLCLYRPFKHSFSKLSIYPCPLPTQHMDMEMLYLQNLIHAYIVFYIFTIMLYT